MYFAWLERVLISSRPEGIHQRPASQPASTSQPNNVYWAHWPTYVKRATSPRPCAVLPLARLRDTGNSFGPDDATSARPFCRRRPACHSIRRPHEKPETLANGANKEQPEVSNAKLIRSSQGRRSPEWLSNCLPSAARSQAILSRPEVHPRATSQFRRICMSPGRPKQWRMQIQLTRAHLGPFDNSS